MYVLTLKSEALYTMERNPSSTAQFNEEFILKKNIFNLINYSCIGIKKNSTKTKYKHISKNMISSPQSDFVHAFHIGVAGK